jgi:hypothetical protein
MEEKNKPVFVYKDVPVTKNEDGKLMFIGRVMEIEENYDVDNLSNNEFILLCEEHIKKIKSKSKSLTKHYGPFEPNPNPKENDVLIEKISTDMSNYIYEYCYGDVEKDVNYFSSIEEFEDWFFGGGDIGMMEELTNSGFEYNDEWEYLIECGEIEEYNHQHDEVIIDEVQSKLISLFTKHIKS